MRWRPPTSGKLFDAHGRPCLQPEHVGAVQGQMASSRVYKGHALTGKPGPVSTENKRACGPHGDHRAASASSARSRGCSWCVLPWWRHPKAGVGEPLRLYGRGNSSSAAVLPSSMSYSMLLVASWLASTSSRACRLAYSTARLSCFMAARMMSPSARSVSAAYLSAKPLPCTTWSIKSLSARNFRGISSSTRAFFLTAARRKEGSSSSSAGACSSA
mmetsp:Transcript_34102/g.97496  ORF Transcript_34102/g.97496 Transcript_34102/m.97496 type:complete len:216 (-) Transcript_34102:1113-1760(-)